MRRVSNDRVLAPGVWGGLVKRVVTLVVLSLLVAECGGWLCLLFTPSVSSALTFGRPDR
jgi:hypothetical protein